MRHIVQGDPDFLNTLPLFATRRRSYRLSSPVSHIVFPRVATLVVLYFKPYSRPVPAYPFTFKSFMASTRGRGCLYPQEVGNHGKVSRKNVYFLWKRQRGRLKTHVRWVLKNWLLIRSTFVTERLEILRVDAQERCSNCC